MLRTKCRSCGQLRKFKEEFIKSETRWCLLSFSCIWVHLYQKYTPGSHQCIITTCSVRYLVNVGIRLHESSVASRVGEPTEVYWTKEFRICMRWSCCLNRLRDCVNALRSTQQWVTISLTIWHLKYLPSMESTCVKVFHRMITAWWVLSYFRPRRSAWSWWNARSPCDQTQRRAFSAPRPG